MWILIIISLTYTHGIRNPFRYEIHVKEITEYKILIIKARYMRLAIISYFNSKRVLQIKGLRFIINFSTYYNTVRYNSSSSDNYQII
jgi:hypothetical protein